MVIALSSGESEYYALVKAGSQSLGVKAIAQDMGIRLDGPTILKSDAVLQLVSVIGSVEAR